MRNEQNEKFLEIPGKQWCIEFNHESSCVLLVAFSVSLGGNCFWNGCNVWATHSVQSAQTVPDGLRPSDVVVQRMEGKGSCGGHGLVRGEGDSSLSY
uniref:Uncharacterized protein n=1 Tax=Caenorhabditis tropicalis TaxID=1561998 RepID=A0A1I7V3Y8_9PELO